MSTRDLARTQRLREEDRNREMAVRRNKPQARKAKSNSTVITLTAGMVIGCLLFWFLGSKGFLPVGGTPVAPAAPAVSSSEQPAAAAPAKRVQPEVDLSFYSQLPAGSAAQQQLEQTSSVNNGVPEFPEVTVTQPAEQAVAANPAPEGAQSALTADGSVAVAPIPQPQQVQPVVESTVQQPLPIPEPAPQPVAVAPAPQAELAQPAQPAQPVEPAVEKVAKPEPAKAEPAKATSRYYLQVGTFKNMNAVEQQRAQLAFAGVSASVRSGKDSSGAAIYRLVVGPFSSPQAADSTKAKLAANGVSSFITR